MPILTYFKSVSQPMLSMLFLGALGFLLIRRKIISSEGLNGLTRLLIEVTMPALIFCSIVAKFNFQDYSNWWKFILLSFLTALTGLLIGHFCMMGEKDSLVKKEFVSLMTFQNSGYLPLTLVGWIVPKEQLGTMLIYLFLFVVGFDLMIWSWGVHYLSSHKSKYFSLGSLFSPPIIAAIAGFVCVSLRIQNLIPGVIMSPLSMLGNCSFPLAIVVVGASLAVLFVKKKPDMRLIPKLVLAKLVLMPLIGLAVVSYVRLPYLVGLLLVLELAVPSATNLAVIVRRYVGEEKLISQGIFITHMISLITIPFFLALFNWIVS